MGTTQITDATLDAVTRSSHVLLFFSAPW